MGKRGRGDGAVVVLLCKGGCNGGSNDKNVRHAANTE